MAALTVLGLAAVPAGTAHAQEKRLKAWGNNRAGQLGDGTWTDFRTTATTVLGLTSAEVVKIAAGGGGPATGHGLALLTDRTVQSWGANGSGSSATASPITGITPVPVQGLNGIQLVAGGREHTVVLLGDNTVRSWGNNGSGRLGNGTTTDSSSPVTTLTALTGVDEIADPVGGDFSLAN
ncbi:RCC1 domain-containing protein [Kitasatospora sp. KL5]|uniref:RCC1 domain-containing protein n=1 Tax=Kitasatospora sp. KL5 TaxID=3425125 RepID=UPI003D6E1152